jgi:hypothetical protein
MQTIENQLQSLVRTAGRELIHIIKNNDDATQAFLMFIASIHDGELSKAIKEVEHNIAPKEIVPTEITKEGIIDLGFNLSSSLGDKEIYVHQTNMMCIFVNGIFSKCRYLSVKPLNIECMQDLITFINFIYGVGN